MEEELLTGTVVNIVRSRGFCFIMGKDGLTRFGHVRDFVSQVVFDRLHEGQLVEFCPMDLNHTGEVIRGNGLRAVRIRTI